VPIRTDHHAGQGGDEGAGRTALGPEGALQARAQHAPSARRPGWIMPMQAVRAVSQGPVLDIAGCSKAPRHTAPIANVIKTPTGWAFRPGTARADSRENRRSFVDPRKGQGNRGADKVMPAVVEVIRSKRGRLGEAEVLRRGHDRNCQTLSGAEK